MFFPEGTRSPDGRVHAFNEGAFRLAVKTGLPILPLALDGAQNALPKHDWRFGASRHRIRLTVLPPVETTGLKGSDAEALRDRVRQTIINQIAEWRVAAPADVDALTPPDGLHESKDSVKSAAAPE